MHAFMHTYFMPIKNAASTLMSLIVSHDFVQVQ